MFPVFQGVFHPNLSHPDQGAGISRYSGSLLKTPKCYIFSFRTKTPVAKTWDEHPHPQLQVFFWDVYSWNEGIRLVVGWNEGVIVLVIPGSSSTHQQRISVSFRTACFGGEEKVTIRREEHLGWDHFGIMEDVVDKDPVFASFFSIIFSIHLDEGFFTLDELGTKKTCGWEISVSPFQKLAIDHFGDFRHKRLRWMRPSFLW